MNKKNLKKNDNTQIYSRNMQNKFGNRRLTSMVTKGMTKIFSRDIENTKEQEKMYISGTHIYGIIQV